MKILGTGLQGLIGSRIVELLSPEYKFENISRNVGVNITDKKQVKEAITKSDADIVLHLAAKADVDGCEEDKIYGKEGSAWQINVEGTKHVALACETSQKKLIYISTDFVFDGEKEEYVEDDKPNPINWYATTKYEGEKIVSSLSTRWLIIRIAYPYRAQFSKTDFVRAVKNRLSNHDAVSMVTDHMMTPTFTDDIAGGVDTLIRQEATGIYHVVGSQFLSPFTAAKEIARVFNLDDALISSTTRAKFFQGRAPRPFRLALKNDKIRKLGAQMSSFTQGLQSMREQL